MENTTSQIIQSDSGIFYNYSTIRITQSRIDKGLIAIPRSLTSWFPSHNTAIKVLLDDSLEHITKNYVSYEGLSNESRIGGLSRWFNANDIKDGDEIVIQLIDRENYIYRLITERNFLIETQKLQEDFDSSETETDAIDEVENIAGWTESKKETVIISEYTRLIETGKVQERESVKRSGQARKGIPSNLRILLQEIYKGHCQLCDFTFLKRDNKPYFETHHINPSIGNHPKNIIVVCANCHRQFEYAKLHEEFTDDGWLKRVVFNGKEYGINQIIFTRKFEKYIKEIHV